MPLHLLITLECMFAAFLLIGLVFFRKGQHGLAWFLTLAPFLAGATQLLLFQAGLVPPLLPLDGLAYQTMSAAAAVLVSAALLLYGCALGSHRARIPMWHQNADSPQQIVSWGVYGLVRHPFYTSYLLLMPACCLASPTWPMLLIAACCVLMLNHTALKEERELLSLFGSEYGELMTRTGRFFPRLGGAGRAKAAPHAASQRAKA